jgi:hypothetical protein
VYRALKSVSKFATTALYLRRMNIKVSDVFRVAKTPSFTLLFVDYFVSCQYVISHQPDKRCMTSGFRHKVDQIRILLAYYIVSSGNPVPKFRHHLQSWRRRMTSWSLCPLKMRMVGPPETSVRNYHSMLRRIPKKCKSQEKKNYMFYLRQYKFLTW